MRVLTLFATILLMLCGIMTLSRCDACSAFWIYYEIYNPLTNESSLHRMWADGSHGEQLTDSTNSRFSQSLSPNRQWIAFSASPNGYLKIFRARLDGTEALQLTQNIQNVEYIEWSPDSQWILFRAIVQNERAVYLIQSDGSYLRQLDDSLFNVVHVEWSPDSRWLLFADNNNTLNRMRIENLQIELLTDPSQIVVPLPYLSPRPALWSPDGEWIAFIATPIGDEFDCLYRIRPDGSDLQHLTDNTAFIGGFNWSPDSNWIAFDGDSLTGHGIHILSSDGTHQTAILGGYDNVVPLWSPDGKWIYFASWINQNFDIYRLHPDGTNLQQLTSAPTDEYIVQFSAQIDQSYNQTRLLIVGFSLLFIGTLVTQMKGKYP